MSGEPAKTCTAATSAHVSASWIAQVRRARMAAATTHDIQHAPARWFQTLTIDSVGPDSTNTAPPTKAAGRPTPRARARA